MTDKELLVLCADAFDATLAADNARKLLKSGRIVNGAAENLPYAGNRSHVLARVMAARIRSHIQSDKILMLNDE